MGLLSRVEVQREAFPVKLSQALGKAWRQIEALMICENSHGSFRGESRLRATSLTMKPSRPLGFLVPFTL
jgi:hypothetical protein